MFFRYRIAFIYFIQFLIVILCDTNLCAQTIRNFPALTEKKGFSVNCIVQSPYGELWIGTPSGLVLYDGKTFKTFLLKDGLSNNAVTALYFQVDNTLWIGHKNGKITLYKNKKFFPFQFNEKLPQKQVSAFSEANGIWISYYGGGIAFYSKKNGLKKFNTDNGLNDNFVYTLCRDNKNNIWGGTDGGILHINTKSSTPSFTFISMKEGLPDNIVRSLIFDDNNNLWIAMQDSGVCRYDINAKNFKTVAGWKYGTTTSLYKNNSGSIFIGTKQNGVIKYNLNNSEKQLYASEKKNELLSNEVNAVFSDREDNLWIATAKGLSVSYQERISYITSKNDLTSNKVLAISVDKKRNYWIATDKGLSKYFTLPEGQTIIKNYFPTEGKLKQQITCIHEDIKGTLWLGTYGNGVYRFDPVTEEQENISELQGLANNNISSICSTKQGDIWISTLGGGISQIKFNNNKTIKNYLAGDYIYCVFTDINDKLWIGTNGEGLIMYDNNIFTNVTKKNHLYGKTIYSIIQDESKNIWFTTSEDGVYKYDGKGFINYSTDNGLSYNNPSVLIPVGDKVIIGHSKGIDMLDIHSGITNYFSVSDDDVQCDFTSGCTDKEGNILIGTGNGILKFRATEIPVDTVTPLLHFTSIIVQYQSFNPDSANTFSHLQNNFIFNFSTVWLRSSENIKVRYKLEHNDTDYSITENKSVSYSNLPPGNYIFSISASNGKDRWSTPLRYSFTILTPIWHHCWFWVLIIMVSVAIIYSFIRYRLKVLRKDKDNLERKVMQRTTEIQKQTRIIEAKNSELERLSIVASETSNSIIILDAQGRWEWVNKSFEKLNCMKLEELKKIKGETIYEASNNLNIACIMNECIETKRSVNFESKNVVNGRIIWESSTLTPIYDEAGILHKFIIIDTDITERKCSEELIRQKNKDITDSIEYAKKIQTSILPDIQKIKESFPESFIFYLQKDIVSGDFYWFTRKGDHAIIAAVDCTGHGVPGAFMSLIGYNLLNQIVNENNNTEPGKILDALNKAVIKALYQNNPNNSSKDGMDIAICNVNLKSLEIQFAGAMRPLYIFRNGILEEMKGDKISIGTKDDDKEHEIKFTTQTFAASKGDSFYISTDGYADQFGGERFKKMMTKKFKQVLKGIQANSFEEQYDLIMNEHIQWRGIHEQVDDILVIGFSV